MFGITMWADLMETEVEEAKVEVMGDQTMTVRPRRLTSPMKKKRLDKTMNSSSTRVEITKRSRNVSSITCAKSTRVAVTLDWHQMKGSNLTLKTSNQN